MTSYWAHPIGCMRHTLFVNDVIQWGKPISGIMIGWLLLIYIALHVYSVYMLLSTDWLAVCIVASLQSLVCAR